MVTGNHSPTTGWAAVLGGLAVLAGGVALLVYRAGLEKFWEEKSGLPSPRALCGPAYRNWAYVVGPIFVVLAGAAFFITGVVSLFR
jgi:hypothetical protein